MLSEGNGFKRENLETEQLVDEVEEYKRFVERLKYEKNNVLKNLNLTQEKLEKVTSENALFKKKLSRVLSKSSQTFKEFMIFKEDFETFQDMARSCLDENDSAENVKQSEKINEAKGDEIEIPKPKRKKSRVNSVKIRRNEKKVGTPKKKNPKKQTTTKKRTTGSVRPWFLAPAVGSPKSPRKKLKKVVDDYYDLYIDLKRQMGEQKKKNYLVDRERYERNDRKMRQLRSDLQVLVEKYDMEKKKKKELEEKHMRFEIEVKNRSSQVHHTIRSLKEHHEEELNDLREGLKKEIRNLTSSIAIEKSKNETRLQIKSIDQIKRLEKENRLLKSKFEAKITHLEQSSEEQTRKIKELEDEKSGMMEECKKMEESIMKLRKEDEESTNKLKSEKKLLQEQLTKYQDDNSEHVTSNNLKDEEISNLLKEKTTITRENEILQHEIQVKDERIRSFEENEELLLSKSEGLSQESTKYVEEIEKLKKTIAKHESSIETTNESNKNQETKISELFQKYQTVTQQLEMERAKLEEFQKGNEGLSETLENQNSVYLELEKSFEEEKKKMGVILQDMESQLTTAKKEQDSTLKKLAEEREEAAANSKKLNDTMKNLENTLSKLEERQIECENLSSQLVVKKDDLEEKEQEILRLSKEMGESEERNQLVLSEKDNLEEELGRLKRSLSETKESSSTELIVLNEELRKLKDDIIKKEMLVNQKSQEAVALQTEKQELEKKTEDFRTQIKGNEETTKFQSIKIEELTEEIMSLKSQNEAGKDDLTSLIEEKSKNTKKLEAEINKMEMLVDEKTQESSLLTTEKAKLEKMCGELESRIEAEDETTKTLQDELKDKTSKLKNLELVTAEKETEIKRKEEVIAKTKQLLQESETAKRETENSLREETERNSYLQNQVEQLRKKHESEITNLKTKKDEEILEIRSKLELVQSSNLSTEEKLKLQENEVQAKAVKMMGEIERLEAYVKSFEQQQTTMRQEKQRLEATQKKIQNELDSKTRELKNMQLSKQESDTNLQLKQSSVEDLEKQIAQIREEMKTKVHQEVKKVEEKLKSVTDEQQQAELLRRVVEEEYETKISELKSQEASKLKKTEEKMAEKMSLEEEKHKHEILELQKKLEDTTKSLNEKAFEITTLRYSYKMERNSSQTRDQDVQDLKTELSKTQTELSTTMEEAESLALSLTELREDMASLVSERDGLASQLRLAKQSIESLHNNNDLETSSLEADRKEVQMNALEENMNSEKTSPNLSTTEIDELRNTNEQLRIENARLAEETRLNESKFSARKKQYREKIRSLKAQLKKQKSQGMGSYHLVVEGVDDRPRSLPNSPAPKKERQRSNNRNKTLALPRGRNKRSLSATPNTVDPKLIQKMRVESNRKKMGKEKSPLEITMEYQDIDGETPDRHLYSTALGHKEKNRYGDILPFNHNIVELGGSKKHPTYINASNMIVNNISYFAAQWPLSDDVGGKTETESDFWDMVYKYESPVIVSLQRPGRAGHPYYWPRSEGEEKLTKSNLSIVNECNMVTPSFQEIQVSVMERKKRKKKRSKKGVKDVKVSVLMYMSWPDHGVPNDVKSLMEVMRRVDEITEEGEEENKKPIIVHCSAGVGRTGVFMVCHSILRKHRGSIHDICDTLKGMRKQRHYLVQNLKQYQYSYDFVWYYTHEGKKK